jgi:hypothetical protein
MSRVLRSPALATGPWMIAYAIAMCVSCIPCQAGEEAKPAAPQESIAPSKKPVVIRLSEEAFREFMDKRQEYYPSLFGSDFEWLTKKDAAIPEGQAVVCIDSPKARVRLGPKAINLHESRDGRIVMLSYFPELITVSLRMDVEPRVFIALARLPVIDGVALESFHHARFCEPFDEETQRAIALLDGRLTWVACGESPFYEHVGSAFFRYLMRVKSMESLIFYGIVGRLELSDFEALRKMPRLREFKVDDWDSSGMSPADVKRAEEIMCEINARGKEREKQAREAEKREPSKK